MNLLDKIQPEATAIKQSDQILNQQTHVYNMEF